MSTSARPPAEPAIGLRGVDLDLAYHGTPVVEAATVQLCRGEVTALVGPNGSGKSTLLRSLARLHRPVSGQVLLDDGTSAHALSAKEFARRVALLAQSRPTPTGISVREVVGYGRHPHRGRWGARDEDGPAAVEWAMTVTGVAPMADRCVDELSGGELQRVWLATCLAQQTSVLLLDEPTTFLDLRYQVEILDLLRDLADVHGVAVGVVLHDLDQAAAVADQVVLLEKGTIVASGPPREVFTSELLSRAYGIHIDVRIDPQTGTIVTQPVGRHTRRVPTPA
ncbi:ABC transporter ATP-binding protein [Thermasporomyces composti]|uniref:Iron complex transport system ATP-binding protein n=1 Tax=Thermasporomyces composti TaxID=696763 RepID=A0A3D9V1Q7_THECX|nr:ABC transporter ATP-binding protein [Thermasporomyces composti]REF35722.1 iron complex transport system ATP-binding protein [Thermasporomyces composti]